MPHAHDPPPPAHSADPSCVLPGDGTINYEEFTKMLHEKDMQTQDLFKFEGHLINEIDGHEGGRGAIHDHNLEGRME